MASDDLIFCVTTKDTVLQNISGGQPLFGTGGNGSVALAGYTTYFFVAQYLLTNTGTNSHSWALEFSGTPAAVSYLVRAHTTTGPSILGATNGIFVTSFVGSPVVTPASTSPTEHVAISIAGVIRTNASFGTTPQISLDNAPGGVITLLAGSFFRATPIGNNTVRTAGSWTA